MLSYTHETIAGVAVVNDDNVSAVTSSVFAIMKQALPTQSSQQPAAWGVWRPSRSADGHVARPSGGMVVC